MVLDTVSSSDRDFELRLETFPSLESVPVRYRVTQASYSTERASVAEERFASGLKRLPPFIDPDETIWHNVPGPDIAAGSLVNCEFGLLLGKSALVLESVTSEPGSRFRTSTHFQKLPARGFLEKLFGNQEWKPGLIIAATSAPKWSFTTFLVPNDEPGASSDAISAYLRGSSRDHPGIGFLSHEEMAPHFESDPALEYLASRLGPRLKQPMRRREFRSTEQTEPSPESRTGKGQSGWKRLTAALTVVASFLTIIGTGWGVLDGCTGFFAGCFGVAGLVVGTMLSIFAKAD